MAIARVQSKVNSTGVGTASSVTVTLTSNATVGNTLMVCSVQSTGVLSQVKYGANSWVPATLTGANNVNVGFGFVPVVEASATIVVTATAAARIAVIVVEYSGRLVACDFPPLQATNAGSTTNATGTTSTTLSANELLFAVMCRAGTFAAEQTAWLTSPTNSFASIVQTSSSSNSAGNDRAIAVLERFATATGTFSTAGTQASAAWANVISTFAEGKFIVLNSGMIGGMQ